LRHLSSDHPILPDSQGGQGGGVLPWTSAALRGEWGDALRSHLAYLEALGLSKQEASAVFPAFPYALLLPKRGLEPAANFLTGLGLSQAELGALVRTCPRVLGFAVPAHLMPAITYLQGCGLGSAALLGLLRTQPHFFLAAVVHKARTDSAASELRAAYALQAEERQSYALQMAGAARASIEKRGW